MTGRNKKTTLTPDIFPDFKNVGKSVLIQTSGARECETLWGSFEEQMVVHMSGRWRPGAEVEQKHCQKRKKKQHNTTQAQSSAGGDSMSRTQRCLSFVQRCQDLRRTAVHAPASYRLHESHLHVEI